MEGPGTARCRSDAAADGERVRRRKIINLEVVSRQDRHADGIAGAGCCLGENGGGPMQIAVEGQGGAATRGEIVVIRAVGVADFEETNET